jgi:hypothetical protein
MNRDYGLDTAPGAGNYPHISKGNAMGGSCYPLLIDQEDEIELLKDIPTINTVKASSEPIVRNAYHVSI